MAQDDDIARELVAKIRQELKDVKEREPSTTTLADFCEQNSISEDSARQIIEAARKTAGLITVNDIKINTVKFKAMRALSEVEDEPVTGIGEGSSVDNLSFTPEQAIKIVITAFSEFDSEMGRLLKEAYEQGRVVVDSSIPEDDTPRRTATYYEEGKPPYLSVAALIPGEELSLIDLGGIAHEAGHLVAMQRHYQEHPQLPQFSVGRGIRIGRRAYSA